MRPYNGAGLNNECGYLPDVERILQVTAPWPAFLALTEMQYSSPMFNSC